MPPRNGLAVNVSQASKKTVPLLFHVRQYVSSEHGGANGYPTISLMLFG